VIRVACAALLLTACERSAESINDSAGAIAGTTPPPSTWTITETGWGPIRAGMSLADARAALGGQPREPRSRECDHLRPPDGPPGVLIMAVEGQVARVEVSDTIVATAAGARVGDAETRIHALYPNRVQTRPHKYVDGHYLIVRRGSGQDSVFRLVFETDGRRVTRYRGGRFLEVEWVEGAVERVD
jgi:hypothetical protein